MDQEGILGHLGARLGTAALWTATAFLGDEQSSTARPPDRHPTSAGKNGQAVSRWVARQDGSLDPDVPARNIPPATRRIATGDPFLGKSHHHPSSAKLSPITIRRDTIANLADGLGHFCRFFSSCYSPHRGDCQALHLPESLTNMSATYRSYFL